MSKYKPEHYLEDEFIEKINAEIEKQFDEEVDHVEQSLQKEQSKIGFFGWIMLGIIFVIFCLKLTILVLAYI